MAKTPLQRAAAAQDDAAEKKKARGLIASLASLLGLSADAAPPAPDAKMSKRTTTTKRVEMEESDEDPEDTEAPEDSTGSDAAEEEEEAEEDSSAEEEAADSEEEEEAHASAPAAASGRTVAKPKASMMRDALAAADKAFLAAMPEAQRASAALRMPSRVVRYAKKATGARSLDAALGALSAMPERAKAQAKIEADVSALKANDRKRRIDEIVSSAKTEGRAGATSKEGRASLRVLGMAQGSKFLRAHVATLPIVASSRERLPKADERGHAIGAPGTDEQKAMMAKAMSGLDAKEAEAFKAIADEKIAATNGAARREEN
jgi:hypothetical protein